MELVKRWRSATLLALATAVVFWVGFQLSKKAAISAISPFADDPYDAVGSIAIQVAGFAGVLSLARVLRIQPDMRDDRSAYARLRFIRNGDIAVVLAVVVTLLTDIVAILQHPASFTLSGWYLALLGALALLAMLAAVSTVALARAMVGLASLPLRRATAPDGAELGEAIDDVLALVLTPARWLERGTPGAGAVVRFAGGALSVVSHPFGWLSPRRHPWRFALAFAVVVGIAVSGAHYVFEGPVPDLRRTIAVFAFFFSVEVLAVLGCYLVFGGVFGLRPPLIPRQMRPPHEAW